MPSVDSLVETARQNTQFGQYRFPENLGPNGFVLDFVEYSYAETFAAVSQTARTNTSIILPLPQQLQDVDNIDVKSADLGTTGALALGVFNTAKGGSSAILSTVQKMMEGSESLGSSIGEAARTGDFTTLSSSLNDYLGFAARNAMTLSPELSLAADVATGTAINPHTTLNFDGVSLKEFTFTWQLAPQSAEESDALRNIVEKIKSHILPKTVGLGSAPGLSRAILKYPDIARIRLNGVAQQYFPNFNPGMVSNFTVDYTPQGNVLLEGGKPAIVNMSLSFQEAQIRTSGAAGNADSSGIGWTDPSGLGVG